MKYYYDLHMHTALSPCASNDMTPNNIVNMSSILGLDILAITDHNSILNVKPCMEVRDCNNIDLIILPGLEVETNEEIHVITLFPDIDNAQKFATIIEENLNKIPLNEKIFGEQIILNSLDEEIGRYNNLLITSTTLDIYQIVELAKQYNGIAIPAHIDRSSYSIISNLGFIPKDLDINIVEFSFNANPEEFLKTMINMARKDYKYIVSSDSHYLESMKDAVNYFEFDKKPTSYDVINYLRNGMIK